MERKIQNRRKTNTSDCLLLNYPYFKFFTESGGKLNLREIIPNVEFTDVRFTDIILIRSSSKSQLMCILKRKQSEEDKNLIDKAIGIGWKYYLKDLLKFIRPDVMVCNSVDFSSFLEKNCTPDKENNHDDIINIKIDNFDVPCVLSGQVTGQRATDKWTLIRMRKAIELSLRNK